MRIIFLILLLLIFTSANASGILLSIGNSTSKDKSEVIKVGYIHQVALPMLFNLSEKFSWEFELAASQWENLYGPDIKVGGITPFIKYQSPLGSYKWFARVGIGVAYIDQTQWGNRSLGDNWLFEDKLEVGLIILNSQRIGLSLTHYSNAALNKNNDGTNIASLNYSIHW